MVLGLTLFKWLEDRRQWYVVCARKYVVAISCRILDRGYGNYQSDLNKKISGGRIKVGVER
jgi:hypothetical protein